MKRRSILTLVLTFIAICGVAACGGSDANRSKASIEKAVSEAKPLPGASIKPKQKIAANSDAKSKETSKKGRNAVSAKAEPKTPIAKLPKNVGKVAKKQEQVIAKVNEAVEVAQAKVKPQQQSDSPAPGTTKPVTIEDVRAKTDQALAVVQVFVKQQEAAYHSKVDKQLAEFNEKVRKLRKQAKKMSNEAKRNISKMVRGQYKEMQVAQDKLANLKNLQGQKGEALVLGLDSVVEKVTKALEGSVAQLEDEKQLAKSSSAQ